ncbi:hypothetical protein NE237_004335 [Protea cynaroides]|uniref:CASP-like protein n=1 Tax=Protea cynaroides TaxID=273540 RepID=A0A9Q0KJ85_9MAGN|nr:hypothetical protein NE237_004335 [Protea cynaroides]
MSPTTENDYSQDNTMKDPETVAPVYIENQSLEHASAAQRVQKEKLLKKNQVGLRIIALFFSSLSFALMASDKQNFTDYFDGVALYYNFDSFRAYRYLVAVGVISTVYTMAQVIRQCFEFRGTYMLSQRASNFLDFFGDQIMAYLLISAASTVIPITDLLGQLKVTAYNTSPFTSSAWASISMAFLAFVVEAVSAGISGYRLCTQAYI